MVFGDVLLFTLLLINNISQSKKFYNRKKKGKIKSTLSELKRALL